MKNRDKFRPSDWLHIMQAARKAFPAGNRYGVRAFGIDRKAKAGRRTREAALNTYVVRKLADPRHLVPKIAVPSRRLSVNPDVVGIGVEGKVHDTGQPPPMLGLYAGATIRVEGPIREFGGVACLLGNTTPTHLLTAGHLFPRNRSSVEVTGGLRARPPVVVGRLLENLLDAPFPSMPFPMDVALVELTSAGARLASLAAGGPELADFVPSDETSNIEVKAFLPTAHDFSRPTETLDGPLDAEIRSPIRGDYFVRDVIGTHAVITHKGDSGTILCDAASGKFAIGVCVGQVGSMSVFEPLERALSLLRDSTGLPLNIL